jgi:hypothetical protein
MDCSGCSGTDRPDQVRVCRVAVVVAGLIVRTTSQILPSQPSLVNTRTVIVCCTLSHSKDVLKHISKSIKFGQFNLNLKYTITIE